MATNAVKPIDPYPDALHGGDSWLSLATIAALHLLPARERAAVTLADVAGFDPRDVAAMLDESEEWVERALRHARGAIPVDAPASPPDVERRVVPALAAALAAVDATRVAKLLAEEVSLGCTRRWAVFRGRERVAGILCERMTDERLLLVPTRANGQPAFGCYVADPGEPVALARGLLALTLAGGLVVSLTRFWDNEVLPYFVLPETIPAPD
jgi:RNA polymerase sigma-70 factor (ECF subfamily)